MIDLLGLVAIMIMSFIILAVFNIYAQFRMELLRMKYEETGDDDE